MNASMEYHNKEPATLNVFDDLFDDFVDTDSKEMSENTTTDQSSLDEWESYFDLSGALNEVNAIATTTWPRIDIGDSYQASWDSSSAGLFDSLVTFREVESKDSPTSLSPSPFADLQYPVRKHTKSYSLDAPRSRSVGLLHHPSKRASAPMTMSQPSASREIQWESWAQKIEADAQAFESDDPNHHNSLMSPPPASAPLPQIAWTESASLRSASDPTVPGYRAAAHPTPLRVPNISAHPNFVPITSPDMEHAANPYAGATAYYHSPAASQPFYAEEFRHSAWNYPQQNIAYSYEQRHPMSHHFPPSMEGGPPATASYLPLHPGQPYPSRDLTRQISVEDHAPSSVTTQRGRQLAYRTNELPEMHGSFINSISAPSATGSTGPNHRSIVLPSNHNTIVETSNRQPHKQTVLPSSSHQLPSRHSSRSPIDDVDSPVDSTPPVRTPNSRKTSRGPPTLSRRSKTSSGVADHSRSKDSRVGFVNYTPEDSRKILTGVAPSGSSKTKARREKEAAEKRRRLSRAATKAVIDAGGDVEGLRRLGLSDY